MIFNPDIQIIAIIPAIIWAIVKIAITMAISYGVSKLLQKKPPSIKANPNTFNQPVIEEGSKYPVIFGTCWIENPIIGWWGDTKAVSRKLRIDDSGGQNMYFYDYYHGANHIIAMGFCDGILQIKVGDHLVWPNYNNKYDLAADAEASAIINLPNLYGGISTYHGNVTLGGGLVGTVDLEYGAATQAVNDYLASVLGSYISASRGLTCAVLRQVYVGTDPQVQAWKYMVKRTAHDTDSSAIWYAAKATIRDYEMNPAHILYNCYTNTEWGLAESTAKLIDADWIPFADALYNEGFGLCMKWEGDQSLEDFIADVKRHIDAIVYEDHLTGNMVPKLIRDDYVPANLEEFDETDITEITEFSRGAIRKIPDVTYLQYWNMYDNLPVVISNHDIGLINQQNEILIPNDTIYNGIVDADLGGQVAAREQYQIGSFPALLEFKAKRTMSHLHPGDVFKLVYPPLGIVSMYVRVLDVKYGKLTDGELTFTAIEDIFGMKSSQYAIPSPGGSYDIPQTEDGIPYPVDFYNTTDTSLSADAFWSDVWNGQTFIASTTYEIKSVSLCMYRVGMPGLITISIKETYEDLPVGDDLCVKEINLDDLTTTLYGEWRNIQFDSPVELMEGTKYAIIVRGGTGALNSLRWRCKIFSSGGWDNGSRVVSLDAGSTWSEHVNTVDLFEIYKV